MRDQLNAISELHQFEENFADVAAIHDEMVDSMLYLQDVFSLKNHKIDCLLVNSLLSYFVLPTLCGGVVSAPDSIKSMNVALYGLNLVLTYCKNEMLLNAVILVLFHKGNSEELQSLIQGRICSPLGYYFSNKEEQKSTAFSDLVAKNLSYGFIDSLIFKNDSKYKEIIEIVAEIESKGEHKSKEELQKSILSLIQSKIARSEWSIITNFHENLSAATGLEIGLSDKSKESPLNLILKILDSDKRNEVKENLDMYINSRDDSLVLLTCLLYNQAIKSPSSNALKNLVGINKFTDMTEQMNKGELFTNSYFEATIKANFSVNEEEGGKMLNVCL